MAVKLWCTSCKRENALGKTELAEVEDGKTISGRSCRHCGHWENRSMVIRRRHYRAYKAYRAHQRAPARAQGRGEEERG
jgi:hypothetical protein